ncbi:neuronal acetylcholine receptor subunit beta-2-like [Diadema setosum]|uniref:neuronal acetylcholine receptor subunit beta-2-like n=1 Tax=Diadema setosum TaxID=31175 RepID=UPI003B3A25A2
MESVWTPPMLIFNSIASHSAESPLQPGASKVAVNQDGSAQIQTSLLHSTTCDINLKAFPFDSHVCVVIFVSQGLRSDVFKFEPAQVLSLDDTYPQWLLTALTADAVEGSDQLHNETVSFLNVRFTLERLPDFFLRMVAAPLQLLNALALITFIIPLKSGERMTDMEFLAACLDRIFSFCALIAFLLPNIAAFEIVKNSLRIMVR